MARGIASAQHALALEVQVVGAVGLFLLPSQVMERVLQLQLPARTHSRQVLPLVGLQPVG